MTNTQSWMWKYPADPSYKSVSSFAEFAKLTNPADAAVAFENHFERAGKPNMSTRISKANKYYDKYKALEESGGLGGFGEGGAIYQSNNTPRRYKNSSGGYGTYKINETINKHDARVKTGGYGGYDDSAVLGMMAEMLTEMRGTNSGINKFNDKELSSNSYYIDGSNKSVNVNQSKAPSKSSKRVTPTIPPDIYKIAKQIASGSTTA